MGEQILREFDQRAAKGDQQDLGQEKWPLGSLPIRHVVHANSFDKKVSKRNASIF
jgi:hypothetical protein